MSMGRIVALALLVGLPCGALAAGGRSKVAVMDVRNVQGVAEGTATILTDIVVSDVARAGHEVISRGDIAAMVGFEKQKQVLGCGDETSCLAEIGGALGVDWMITGQVGQIGSQYRISLLLVDSRKARVAARAAEFCEKNEDALVRAAQGTVAQILATIAGGAAPPAARREAKPVPLPPPPTLAPRKEPAPATAVAQPPPLPASAPQGGRPDRTKAWIAFGASGALMLSGALMGLAAKGRYDDLKALEGKPGFAEAWIAREKTIRRTAGMADLLYLGSAASAGLGAWWFVTAEKVAVGPVVAPGEVGLAATGRF
jgi:TolB-like protein